MKIKINTTLDRESGSIKVDTIEDFEIEGVAEKLSTLIMETREKAIRDALIRLGWTPPRESATDPLLTLPQRFEKGMTVAELKRVLADLPEGDGDGEPFEVWMMTGKNVSSQVRGVCGLNRGDVLFESDAWEGV
jgi:hypothetical protein